MSCNHKFDMYRHALQAPAVRSPSTTSKRMKIEIVSISIKICSEPQISTIFNDYYWTTIEHIIYTYF